MAKKIDIELIKRLRQETGAPIVRVKEVIEAFEGNGKKALEVLRREGFEKAEERVGRETGQGKIFIYSHHTGKVVGVAELLCETDFVARNELFENVGRDIAMQVASMGGENLDKQEFIKDPSKKVGDLVKEVIAKTGENVRIGRVFRVELGKE